MVMWRYIKFNNNNNNNNNNKMTLDQKLEIKVDTVVSGTFRDYYEKLKKNLQYMGERLQKFRSQRMDLLNKDREYQAFEVGQIV